MSDSRSVWSRPRTLGYPESLRGLGGIVSPLLAGFSLAAITLLLTTDQTKTPPQADWAIVAFTVAVVLLLFSMQVAFEALRQNSSPADVLMWRPEATVSIEELRVAREAQAADLAELTRLAGLSFRVYGPGLIAFLTGLLLVLVPRDWTASSIIGVALAGSAIALEAWWLAANRWHFLPHPVSRRIKPGHRSNWVGEAPPLDAGELAAVIDPDRRAAAGLPPLSRES